jgi:nitroimidazol reductase NimA-like FMN-containing flavoprotein (pyridoxamine 5'-phosphate oxidase superfamily)
MREAARTPLRRRDRARSWEWVEAELRRAPWGQVAGCGEDGPFLHANLFVYDPDRGAVYFHGPRVGALPARLASPTPLVFVTTRMGRLLPAETALEFSVEYASVELRGTGRRVEDPGEARGALERLLARYAPELRPGHDYRPITDGELERTAVYRLDVEAWAGKENVAAPDRPGAFEFVSPTPA